MDFESIKSKRARKFLKTMHAPLHFDYSGFLKILKKQDGIRQFKRGDIPNLRYGIVHARYGYPDGVSIVMGQIEGVMTKNLKVPKKNIYYLVGRSKIKNSRIKEHEILYDDSPVEELIKEKYSEGFGGGTSETIEQSINEAKEIIENFVKKNKIDVLLAHNSSHPVNFIYSVALSRYYRDAIAKGGKTPKYLLWWHDSHLERKHFSNPSRDVENYLLQGVPGSFVEYIIFINSLQFKQASRYLKLLDKRNPGFFDFMKKNHDVVYNTTDVFINKFRDLQGQELSKRVDGFFEDFKVKDLLRKKHLQLSDTLFCLQHTRLVNRKRVDFALEYCFALMEQLRKKGLYKGMYFLVSGHSAKATRKRIEKLHKKLKKAYKIPNFFLVFAEDFYDKTDITFEEYPKIFAKLGGFSTYFSEVEGFGNNLLEILASGLIPVVYTYDVFKKDIAKYRFKVIALDKYEINPNYLEETIDVLKNKTKQKEWVDQNLRILRRYFAHRTMAVKLIQAITSKREHK
jgi:hypothetical protein